MPNVCVVQPLNNRGRNWPHSLDGEEKCDIHGSLDSDLNRVRQVPNSLLNKTHTATIPASLDRVEEDKYGMILGKNSTKDSLD